MSHHVVEAQNLHFTYPDGTHAVNGISFKIEHGESVAIIGANGAGKSTLLRHLNGYFIPTRGSLKIGDNLVTRKTLPIVRRTVGMVFQNSDDQLFMPTVFDDVAFGPLNIGIKPEKVEELVKKALDTVGASHLINRPPYKLSGGEKRAVSIACVLSMSPDILVLDEPTSSLDPKARRTLINLLKNFHHTRIIVTHDLDMAVDVCERTIVLKRGKVVADAPTMEILRDQEFLTGSHLEKPLRMQSCPICERKCECQIKELEEVICG